MIQKLALITIVGLTAVSCGGKKKSRSSAPTSVSVCEADLVKLYEKADSILNPTGPYDTPYNSGKPLDSTKALELKKLLSDMKEIRNPESPCQVSTDEDAAIYNTDFVEGATNRIPENLRG